MKKIKKYLGGDVLKFVNTSTPEEIASLIELGYFTRKASNKVNTISTYKGQQGEQYVFDILKDSFKLKDTSKIPKSGDFQIQTEQGWIMVEVKNYSSTVGKNELDKFYRDLDRNNNVCGGLFISLYSSIVGKGKIQLNNELIGGRNIPVVYVSGDQEDIIQLVCDMLITRLKINSDTNEKKFIRCKIEQLSEDLTLLSQVRDSINCTRNMMNKSLSDMYNMISSAEINLLRTISDIKSEVNWKRMIPYSNFKELWSFVKGNFDIFEDERLKDVKLLKKMLILLHDDGWYYNQNGIMINNWKIFIYVNKINVKFPNPKFKMKKPISKKNKKYSTLKLSPETFEELKQIYES